ncbi:universal stress protein [Nigerium massiliense]|uniref:universal stress protein n=1 Tax=Nigerium massiliense TaxID=1522317 RepID=UPI000694E990|nr:universal stress protein [Nigerium massiliense]
MSNSAQSMNLAGRIVVGTDLSPRAGKAVDWAAARAARLRLPLTIVLSIPEVIIPARTSIYDATVTPDFLDRLTQRGKEKLRTVNDHVREGHPDLDAQTLLVHGEPDGVLIEASPTAALVVVGSRGRSAPVSMPVLGGTSDGVVTHARGPVVVVPDHDVTDPNGPVVVGVDDAPESLEAIKVAVDEAVARGVALRAVHGWEQIPWAADVALGWSVDNAALGASLRTMVDDLVAPYVADHPGLDVTTSVEPGRPSEVLVDATRDASMLVVGSRGRGGFAGLMLGSTSREVLRGTRCPVLVVRRPKQR